MKFFDIIIFIKSKKIEVKRFKLNNGSKELFNFLDGKQLSDKIKIRHCNYVVVNDKNFKILKKTIAYNSKI